MKKFVLLVALALLALAAPVSAAEPVACTPTTTLDQQAGGLVPQPIDRIPPLIQYCSVVNGTSCTTVGAKKACTDICHNQLSCTCTYFYSNPSVKFWYCDQEC
jgi:hypothetical protein